MGAGAGAPRGAPERRWALWPALPLQPGGSRATTLEELVPGRIWALEQLQGTLDVLVNSRMTVVKLRDGGLFCFCPLAPTKELMELMRGLEVAHGPVRHIVLPTTAVEHKVFLGPFARKFPEADVWAAPLQWSVPPLPSRFLGFPARSQALPASSEGAKLPWGSEFEHASVNIPLGVGPFYEVAFFHKPTGTLLVVDAVVRVPRDPPLVNLAAAESVDCLLNRARQDGKENGGRPLEPSPENLRRGWQKTVLFSLFFQPRSVAPMLSDPGFLVWDNTWEGSFATVEGLLLVPPIVRTLCFSKGPCAVQAWVEAITRWKFRRIIPAHFSAPITAGPQDFRKAFSYLDGSRRTPPPNILSDLVGALQLGGQGPRIGGNFLEGDMELLRDISTFVETVGLSRGKEGA